MENFTIHIFGYGETQINSKDLSVKVKTSTLTKVTPLTTAIWAKKPADSTAVENFHAVNIFGYNDVRWMCKDGFSVKKDSSLKWLISVALIVSLIMYFCAYSILFGGRLTWLFFSCLSLDYCPQKLSQWDNF
jgi:hypothetical protein